MTPEENPFIQPMAALLANGKFKHGPTPYEEPGQVERGRLHFFKETADRDFICVSAAPTGGLWHGSAHCLGSDEDLPYAEPAKGFETPIRAAAEALAELQKETKEDLTQWLR